MIKLCSLIAILLNASLISMPFEHIPLNIFLPPDHPAITAASRGKVKVLRQMLKGGDAKLIELLKDCREVTLGDLITPLAAAAQAGNVNVVEMLLLKRPYVFEQVNARHHNNLYPLHYAFRAKDPNCRREIIKLMLTAGALTHIRTNNNDTLLHLAVLVDEPELVALFLEKGVNPFAENDESRSLLGYGIFLNDDDPDNVILAMLKEIEKLREAYMKQPRFQNDSELRKQVRKICSNWLHVKE